MEEYGIWFEIIRCFGQIICLWLATNHIMSHCRKEEKPVKTFIYAAIMAAILFLTLYLFARRLIV